MKDKEKQINEMAKDLEKVEKEAYSRLVKETQAYVKEHYRYNSKEDYSLAHTKTVFELTAEEMTKLGWVKLPKDSVVLSKEEYQKDFSNQFNKGYKYGSKETAEKILRELKHSEFKFAVEINRSSQEDVSKALEELRKSIFGKINELAKEFGVEIKE